MPHAILTAQTLIVSVGLDEVYIFVTYGYAAVAVPMDVSCTNSTPSKAIARFRAHNQITLI